MVTLFVCYERRRSLANDRRFSSSNCLSLLRNLDYAQQLLKADFQSLFPHSIRLIRHSISAKFLKIESMVLVIVQPLILCSINTPLPSL